MKSKKAQFTMNKFLISVVFVGFIASVIGITISNLNINYEQDNFNSSAIDNYEDILLSAENNITEIKGNVTGIKSSESVFDIIGNFINKATAPFRLLANAYILLVGDNGIVAIALSSIGLNQAVYNALNGFILSVIIIFIFIRVFLFKIFLGKEDN